MTACVKAVATDGGMVLMLDPTVSDLSQCAYTVEDGSSTAWRELGSLSLQNAVDITFSIVLLWAGAFAFKLVRRALDIGDEKE